MWEMRMIMAITHALLDCLLSVQCRGHLAELDAAVRKGGGYIVAGRFTYADITMATALSLVDWLNEPWSKYAANLMFF